MAADANIFVLNIPKKIGAFRIKILTSTAMLLIMYLYIFIFIMAKKKHFTYRRNEGMHFDF